MKTLKNVMGAFLLLLGIAFFNNEAHAQKILNGSFELNKIPAGHDFWTCFDPIGYDTLMSHSKIFELDTSTTSNRINVDIHKDAVFIFPPYPTIYPVDGTWFIFAGPYDTISLEFDTPLIARHKYSISYYDRGLPQPSRTVNPLTVGISDSSKLFGKIVYTSPLPSKTAWTKRTFDIVVPDNFIAKHLTFILKFDNPSSLGYSAYDDFQVECVYPYLNLGADTILCGANAYFLDARQQDTGIAYQWQDGSPDSTFTATQTGWYWCAVTNHCGTFTDSVFIQFDTVPVFDLGRDTVLCPGQPFQLSSGFHDSAYTYSWNTGSTDSILPITAPGLYRLTVTNTCGSWTDSVRVNYFPLPSLFLGNDTTLCNGQTLLLRATQADTGFLHLWNTGSTDSTLLVAAPGWYRVTVSNTCGSWTDSVKISYWPDLNVSLGRDTVLCKGQTLELRPKLNDTALSYQWSTGSTDSILTINLPGWYSVTVQGRCTSATDSIWVSLDSVYFDLGADTAICQGSTLLLNSGDTSSTSSYLWSTGQTSKTILVSTAGTYRLTKTNGFGCNYTDSIKVTTLPVPEATLRTKIDTCQGVTITLNAGNTGFRYSWNTGDTTQTIQVTAHGIYKIKVYNSSCFDEDSVTISYHAPIKVDLGSDQHLCLDKGETYTLDAGNGIAYLWNTGYNGRFELGNKPGIYWVSVTDQYGCVALDSIELFSKCQPDMEPTTIYIPNSFTPNGDGRNDVLEVVGQNITAYSISIFDRWGMKVFESNSLSTSWDGTFRGQPVLTNGFVYVIEYSDLSKATFMKIGEIYLLK